MNFIRLQGLAAKTVSGRNNGLHSCYVEFPPRAKTGFSYVCKRTLRGVCLETFSNFDIQKTK